MKREQAEVPGLLYLLNCIYLKYNNNNNNNINNNKMQITKKREGVSLKIVNIFFDDVFTRVSDKFAYINVFKPLQTDSHFRKQFLFCHTNKANGGEIGGYDEIMTADLQIKLKTSAMLQP